MIKQYILIGASVIIAGILSTSNVSAQISMAYEGYKLFEGTCFLCHGTDGKGNGPLSKKLGYSVADLSSDDRVGTRTDRDLFRIIQGTAPHGTVSKDMPQWGVAISEPQIRSLVAYIRFLNLSKYPLTGNPELGKTIYQYRCTACHGSNGNGRGPLTNVIEMKPADHTDSVRMGQFSNEKLHNIISNGSAGASLMPAWKDILSQEEIESVVGYIRLLSAH